MSGRAVVTVDLRKVAENTRRVVDALGGRSVIGVTKVTCGSAEVARAMLAGGAAGIADSRLENLAGLRAAGIDVPLWLLRAPVPVLADETVRVADVSLESEVETIEALDAAAYRLGRRHSVVAMVDLGDLREGMLPDALPAFVERAEAMPNIELLGIGTSLTCYGAIVPDAENLGELVALAQSAEARIGRRLLVSGGMSSSLGALVAGTLPGRVDSLRIGESILLGVSTVTRQPTLGLHTDAIVAYAPVIEVMRKPSAPRGTVAQDAFGGTPTFRDRGERLRAICAIGHQDVVPTGIKPLDSRIGVLGASSDHLVLDVEDMPAAPRVGDEIAFLPGYAATLRLFTSAYVEKRFVGE
ncbi:MAG: alanine/ornithine racemase family PLP-dependent enzyme [Coriobacteriia bacterium]|nr:alanine/ornithine racemase family PLP-dependent enzyme [Actinomycetota bacterium]MDZ4167605.1 alanine/ornithine racemase family PLP-dependent enzyme [Coriobacteriia bacterium]